MRASLPSDQEKILYFSAPVCRALKRRTFTSGCDYGMRGIDSLSRRRDISACQYIGPGPVQEERCQVSTSSVGLSIRSLGPLLKEGEALVSQKTGNYLNA